MRVHNRSMFVRTPPPSYGTVLMHSSFAQSAALTADDPPALAHGRTALLWRTFGQPRRDASSPGFTSYAAVCKPACAESRGVWCLSAASSAGLAVHACGTLLSARQRTAVFSQIRVCAKVSKRRRGSYAYCTGLRIPLLEPDPPRNEGVLVNGRVFPYTELQQYGAARTRLNNIRYQAEDHAYELPHVHVRLTRFDACHENIVQSLLVAHVNHRLTVDACFVNGGAKWTRFTSQPHTKKEFECLRSAPRLFTTTGRGGLRGVYERLFAQTHFILR